MRYQLFVVSMFAALVLTGAILGCVHRDGFGGQGQICYVNRLGADGYPEIDCIDTETQKVLTIVRGEADAFFETVSFAPDRQWLAFSMSKRNSAQGKSVWFADMNGSLPTVIASGFEQTTFVWLDNSKLLIMGSKSGWLPANEGESCVYDFVQQQKNPVFKTGDLNYCIQEGTSVRLNQIAVLDNGLLGLGHLQVRDTTLSQLADVPLNVSNLPKTIQAQCLSWTPDLQLIVLKGTESSTLPLSTDELYLSRDKGNSFSRLTEFEQDYADVQIWNFVASPNGKWVAMELSLSRPRSASIPQGIWIAIANTESRKVNFIRQIPEDERGFAWSPDSSFLAIALPARGTGAKAQKQIFVIDLENLTESQVTFDAGAKDVFDWR